MSRQRWFGVAVAVVAVLALLVLFLPSGAFAQDADATPAGNGQYGQAMRGNGNGHWQMDGSHNAQVHANGAGQGDSVRYGHAGADHSMMGSAGMSSHAHMGSMMGVGGMMHGTAAAGAMHQRYTRENALCAYGAEHTAECSQQPQATGQE